MKVKMDIYFIIKKVHLYASLSIVALLLMYLVTSYMMIHHQWFAPSENREQAITVRVEPSIITDENWDSFLHEHRIKGRLSNKYFTTEGDLIREYTSAASHTKITISKHENAVEIEKTNKNEVASIIGIHRQRGYGGSIQYNLYAILLDVAGLSLILFAITGIILWLKLLRHNKIAWGILILGFIYFSFVVGYLLLV